MATVASRVEKYVKHLNRGSVFTFSTVVSKIGDAQKDTVNHALKRLVKRNEIVHIKKGIYSRPKISRFGPIPVETVKVVQATANNINAKVYPSGAFALNALGLSTQLVMSQSFISSKRIAPFKVNNTNIKIHYSRSLERLEQGLNTVKKTEREKIILLWLSLEYLGERETNSQKTSINKVISSLSPKAKQQLSSKLVGKLRWANRILEI